MATVIRPCLDSFYEAFSNIVVYQRTGYGRVMCRRKRVKPTEPTSAHTDPRAAGWARAVAVYNSTKAAGRSLTDCIADYALSPDSPKNVTLTNLGIASESPERYRLGITWDPVTRKYNGWPLTNLDHYRIHIYTDAQCLTTIDNLPPLTDSYSIVLDPGLYGVTVQALDAEGNPSTESALVTIQLSNPEP